MSRFLQITRKIPLPAWIGLFCVSIYFLTNSGADNSEASYHQMVAHQIITKGEISFPDGVPGIMTVGIDGRTYASHEMGNTLYLLPGEMLKSSLVHFGLSPNDEFKLDHLSRMMRSFQNSLTLAGVFIFYFLILTKRFQVMESVATACVLLLAFTTFLWGYAGNMFDGVLCALLWTAAFYYFLGYWKNQDIRSLIACMLVSGAAVITRMSMVLPLLLFLGAIFWQVRVRPMTIVIRDLAIAGTVLMPFAGWQMWYNHIRTGSILTSPVQTAQYAINNGLDGNWLEGIAGLLVSPGKGLIFYAPLLIVALLGLPRLWKANRFAVVYLGVAGLIWLLLHGKMRSWYGGTSWGPRYFLTVLPLLMLPLAYSLPLWWKAGAWRRAIVILLAGWGFFLQSSVQITDWQFRVRHAYEQGWLADDDFYWNLQRNQISDALGSCWNNVKVMAGVGTAVSIQDATPIGIYVNNRWSNWALRLGMMNVPIWLIALPIFALLALAVLSMWNILAKLRAESLPAMPSLGTRESRR